jgi:hypothetical protein
MDSTNPQTAAETGPGKERRSNLQMREIFEAAYKVMEPFMDPKQCWSGVSLGLYAHHALRESFPDLGAQEISILHCAVERVYCLRQHAVPAGGGAPAAL